MFNKVNKEYIDALCELDQLKAKHEREIDEQNRNINELFKKRQKVCPHTHTRKEDAYNYHHREEWTIIRCTMCDKQLEKY